MRARFIGHTLPGWAGPDPIQILPGVWLKHGTWEEVGDDVAGRLSGHPHVEVEQGEAITDWRSLDKAALDAYAAGHGVKLDRRKSLDKMQADFGAAIDGRN